MNHSPGALTSVRWNSLFPWLILVRAARVSLMLRVIALALAGLFATHLGWRLVERAMLEHSGPAQSAPLERLDGLGLKRLPGLSYNGLAAPLATHPVAAVTADSRALAVAGQIDGSPLIRGWRWAAEPWVRLRRAAGWRAGLGYAAAGIWSIVVWALCGGAIARVAAVYLCYGETIGPVAALRAAAGKWRSATGAILLSAVAILVLALPLVVAGWLLRLDLTAVLIGLLWFGVLVSGLVLAVALIGIAIGWPFMWSTVAVERTDAFDAVSRGIGYVYQRPLHLAFYVVAASLLGLLAQAAVNLIVDSTLAAAQASVSMGAGDQRLIELEDPARSRLESIADNAIDFWTSAFAWIAAGFPMAYLWPAAVGIYLLQRRHIDSTEMTEVKFDDGELERGLPPLTVDPKTGVPHPAEEAPQRTTA